MRCLKTNQLNLELYIITYTLFISQFKSFIMLYNVRVFGVVCRKRYDSKIV